MCTINCVCRFSHNPLAGSHARSGGSASVVLGVGFKLFRVSTAVPSDRIYSGIFWLTGEFKPEVARLPAFLDPARTDHGGGFHLWRYLACPYYVLGLQHATLADHLSAIQSFRRLSWVAGLDTRHSSIRNAMKGVARGHAAIFMQQ